MQVPVGQEQLERPLELPGLISVPPLRLVWVERLGAPLSLAPSSFVLEEAGAGAEAEALPPRLEREVRNFLVSGLQLVWVS